MKFLGMSSESTRSRAKTRSWPTLQKGDLQAKLHASELRNFQMFENASDHSPVRGEDVALVQRIEPEQPCVLDVECARYAPGN